MDRCPIGLKKLKAPAKRHAAREPGAAAPVLLLEAARACLGLHAHQRRTVPYYYYPGRHTRSVADHFEAVE